MGQFTTRPEEPTEWAGLPSEPIETGLAGDSLGAPIESAASLAFLAGKIESVVIPLAPMLEGTDTTEANPAP